MRFVLREGCCFDLSLLFYQLLIDSILFLGKKNKSFIFITNFLEIQNLQRVYLKQALVSNYVLSTFFVTKNYLKSFM